jgi:HK97 family phage major capsid protein
MADIKTLREQAAKTLTEARSMLDAIGDKSTPEQRAEAEKSVDRALSEVSDIEARVERMSKLEAAEQRAADAIDAEQRARREAKRPGADAGEARAALDGATYRSAFAKYACGMQDDLTAEERALLRSGVASQEARAQVAGTTTAGGYTVPTELMQEIEISMIASGPMYSTDICRVISTASGNPMTLPTIDDTTQTDEAHTEAGAVTDDGGKDVTVGQKTLGAYAYNTEWVRWSWELQSDSDFSWEGILGELLGERMGRGANQRLTTGTGSGQANGIVTAASLGKTTTAIAAVTADEILDFVHSVNPAYRSAVKSRVMFNDTTLLALRKLKDGDGNYLLKEAPDGSGRLVVGSVSIPYSINQAVASMGTGNRFMVYGDFGKYFVRKVAAPTLFVARERFAPDQGILGLIRFDGELSNTSAVKYMANA